MYLVYLVWWLFDLVDGWLCMVVCAVGVGCCVTMLYGLILWVVVCVYASQLRCGALVGGLLF